MGLSGIFFVLVISLLCRGFVEQTDAMGREEGGEGKERVSKDRLEIHLHSMYSFVHLCFYLLLCLIKKLFKVAYDTSTMLIF